MLEIAGLERVLWSFSFFLNVALVFLLAYRRIYRTYPFFCAYAASTVLQSITLFVTYRAWGFGSPVSSRVGWSTQGLISLMRAAAVAEICYSALGRLTGIWRLAWRLLAVSAGLVALYAWALSKGRWQFAILNLDRGLELVMATVIVLLFVFVRYYEVVVQSSIRTLAIGFFLFSAFRVLDDSILERWLQAFVPLWNLIGTLTFLASLLLWGWALGQKREQAALEPDLLTQDYYRSLSPAINARLKNLNERLGHFWSAQGEKT